jgi:uncharacterized phage protein (TIGR01671 family)
MNREIKFRVFYKPEKLMISWFTLTQSAWNTFLGDTPTSLLYSFLVSDKDNYEVMQYTGLIDKNGKEIYENDIIKDESSTFKVEFDRGKFDFVLLKGALQFPYFGSNCSRMEVIGNVFENPELLQE